jgi:hypothetical protein
MEADIRSYSSEYPKIQFKNIAIKNPAYPAVAKVFYVPGQFYLLSVGKPDIVIENR